MYYGLVKLVLVDPSSAGAVFDFLWPHFLRFFGEVKDRILCCFHEARYCFFCILSMQSIKVIVYHVKFEMLLIQIPLA